MLEVKEFIIKSPYVRIGCTLGEGPIYDPDTSTLHFVDISENKVFHLNTETLHLEVEQFDEPISCLALRHNGEGLACAAAQGFGILGGESSLTYFSKPLSPEEAPHTRFNDGACDRQGRFYAGTVFSEQHGVPGKLYCYDPALGTCEVVDPGPFTDSNGLGWSPDEKTFYFTDSLVNKIYAYDYENGKLSNRRVAIDALEQGFSSRSFCDGLCVDSEGFIWSARWGGSRIVRFATDGSVNALIIFPTALNITSCCFGGSGNDKLFVTTAHCGALGGDAARQSQYPDSGHLFLVDFSGKYRGLDRHRFSG